MKLCGDGFLKTLLTTYKAPRTQRFHSTAEPQPKKDRAGTGQYRSPTTTLFSEFDTKRRLVLQNQERSGTVEVWLVAWLNSLCATRLHAVRPRAIVSARRELLLFVLLNPTKTVAI